MLQTKGGEHQAGRELTDKCPSHRISRFLLVTTLWDNSDILPPSDTLVQIPRNFTLLATEFQLHKARDEFCAIP